MAWVRPKHPRPKKPKPDPVFTLLPMLSYISGSSRPPPPVSPTKAKPQRTSSTPLSRDPILRSFQQTQAVHEEEPESVIEEPRPKHQHQHHSQPKHHAPSHPSYREEHHEVASHRSRTSKQSHRDPSPPPPPPPPLASTRSRPRVPSYERHQPVEVVRERYVPRLVDYPSYQARMASRATSARWASATAPLDIR